VEVVADQADGDRAGLEVVGQPVNGLGQTSTGITCPVRTGADTAGEAAALTPMTVI
jgi:hypothetical protein